MKNMWTVGHPSPCPTEGKSQKIPWLVQVLIYKVSFLGYDNFE